jgi:hypothetical protein
MEARVATNNTNVVKASSIACKPSLTIAKLFTINPRASSTMITLVMAMAERLSARTLYLLSVLSRIFLVG